MLRVAALLLSLPPLIPSLTVSHLPISVPQWMESYCLHYHLSPDVASELTPYLRAGDDARAVRWMKIDPNQTEFQQLYASHRPIIERAAEKWKEMNRKGNEQ